MYSAAPRTTIAPPTPKPASGASPAKVDDEPERHPEAHQDDAHAAVARRARGDFLVPQRLAHGTLEAAGIDLGRRRDSAFDHRQPLAVRHLAQLAALERAHDEHEDGRPDDHHERDQT